MLGWLGWFCWWVYHNQAVSTLERRNHTLLQCLLCQKKGEGALAAESTKERLAWGMSWKKCALAIIVNSWLGGATPANSLVHRVRVQQAPGEGIWWDISIRLHLPCQESSQHYVILWLHNLRNSTGPTEESPGRVKAVPSRTEVSGCSQGWNPLQIWMRPHCDGWEASTLHILTSPQVATHLIAETKQLLLKSTPSSS